MRRVLNSLLQFIEGDDSTSLIVAATNSLSMLDMALFRRFDDVLHYKRPGEAEVGRLLRNRLGGFLGRYKLDPIIATALGLSHSEITLACDDAIKETILADRERVQGLRGERGGEFHRLQGAVHQRGGGGRLRHPLLPRSDGLLHPLLGTQP